MAFYHQETERALPGAEESAAWTETLDRAGSALAALRKKHGKGGAPFYGVRDPRRDFAAIAAEAKDIRARFSDLVVIGTGGSSLGAKCLSQLAQPGGSPRLHFLENADPASAEALHAALNPATTCFLLVSKSGGTVETLAQGLVALARMRERVGDRAPEHFRIVTQPESSPLRTLATREKIRLLDHDPAIGGRFSVFSVVGLLPAACLGLDARAVHAGAESVLAGLDTAQDAKGFAPAFGAALQVHHLRQGRPMQVVMPYVDRLYAFAYWCRQLISESLGKDGIGVTPIATLGAVDQHSMMQLFLDGPRDKWFTLITAEQAGQGARIPADPALGSVSYIGGKTVGDVMEALQRGTYDAIAGRGLPVRRIHIPALDEKALGALLMHWMLETVISADLLGVNAFDQPAVEDGKIRAKAYLERSAS